MFQPSLMKTWQGIARHVREFQQGGLKKIAFLSDQETAR
jgi:hypothetical protein